MKFLPPLLGGLLAVASLSASAQEATIRKNIAERLPQMPKIEEVSKTPMPGLFEIRVSGADIFYTDAEGNFLIQGQLFDTRQRRNLTEERIEKLTAVNFDSLPLKDAFTVVRGNGKRKIAVFTDPNCGYCKRLERDLEKVGNITIYNFLYPILNEDSAEKSKNIWCAKDRNKAWQDWMLNNQPPAAASCDVAAIARNVELGRKHKVTGTPTVILSNGARVPGAISAPQLEKLQAEIK